MEKRRIRLEINGVVCGLITQESDEYMDSLAKEVGELMQNVMASAPYITREAAALTAALSFCDDARKNHQEAEEFRGKTGGQPAPEDPELPEKLKRLEELEQENARLKAAAVKDGKAEQEEKRLREARELRLKELETENEALRRDVREKTALAEQAREEKEKAVAEAKRAAEAAGTQTAVSGPETVPAEKPAPAAPAAGPRPAGRRRNPLRPEEEFEQQGFVSFFQKSE